MSCRSDDPSRFKANPELMASKLEDSEEEEEEDEDEGAEKEKTGQKYVAPKNVPKHFDEDKSKEEIMVRRKVNFPKPLIYLSRQSMQPRRRSLPSPTP